MSSRKCLILKLLSNSNIAKYVSLTFVSLLSLPPFGSLHLWSNLQSYHNNIRNTFTGVAFVVLYCDGSVLLNALQSCWAVKLKHPKAKWDVLYYRKTCSIWNQFILQYKEPKAEIPYIIYCIHYTCFYHTGILSQPDTPPKQILLYTQKKHFKRFVCLWRTVWLVNFCFCTGTDQSDHLLYCIQ